MAMAWLCKNGKAWHGTKATRPLLHAIWLQAYRQRPGRQAGRHGSMAWQHGMYACVCGQAGKAGVRIGNSRQVWHMCLPGQAREGYREDT